MIVIVVFIISFRFRFQDEGEIKKQAFLAVSTNLYQGCQENFWALGQKETCHPPPPPILQIMILKLSPPRCVISKESVQQK
jgi:hypothetical protein